MLASVISRTALQLLVMGARQRDQRIIGSYWDLVYLVRVGIPEVPIPDPEGPLVDWNRPQPDPAPWLRDSSYQDDILFNLVQLAASDPTPQPNFFGVLQDRKPRLAAAERAQARLQAGLAAIEKEIKALR